MKPTEFTNVLNSISDLIFNISTDAFLGDDSSEILSNIPVIAYPKEIYEWITQTASALSVDYNGWPLVYFVNGQWQFIKPL